MEYKKKIDNLRVRANLEPLKKKSSLPFTLKNSIKPVSISEIRNYKPRPNKSSIFKIFLLNLMYIIPPIIIFLIFIIVKPKLVMKKSETDDNSPKLNIIKVLGLTIILGGVLDGIIFIRLKKSSS
jgi:hypothetical protein